ncbi:hypothetical protein C8R46DRAFT_1240461 [Mycena filopes]|nr:hypothetical protein C8R46DRAFT_1240461 [Mycena filopes]
MPEKGVVRLNEREIHWEECQQPVSVDRVNDDLFMGALSGFLNSFKLFTINTEDFVAHSSCCADVDGGRPTFTVHVSSPADPNFVPLPWPSPPSASATTTQKKTKGKKTKPSELPPFYCKSCHSSFSANDISDSDSTDVSPASPAADFVNNLKIRGRLSAKARGKELVIAICNKNTGRNFVFRIGFALEAHCFWIPTDMYWRIVSEPAVTRGLKSQAYAIPDEYIDGPAKERCVSIQAAFIHPDYTLLFVDHNVFITFHLMQMPPSFTPSDLRPESTCWHDLWSHNHGPVYSQEPITTLQVLDKWRARIVANTDNLTSIYMMMKTQQEVFNGSGAQEATDQLLLAFIHPQMPAFHVCTHDKLWLRFRKSFIDYDASRMALALSAAKLPYVSSRDPFRMNNSGHTKYLRQIFAYRHSVVKLDQADVEKAHQLGLFVPNAVIQPDGYATGECSLVSFVGY